LTDFKDKIVAAVKSKLGKAEDAIDEEIEEHA